MSEPATWIVPLTSCALAGISTDFVTPWRVRSPVRVTSDAVPASAAAGISTGLVSVKVAVGNWSVWSPSSRMRLSRCDLSEVMEVVSTVSAPAVRVVVEPDDSSVIEPVTWSVRPTASLSAGRLASCSRTR